MRLQRKKPEGVSQQEGVRGQQRGGLSTEREKNIIMNEGMTAVSEHMAKYNHKEGDIESKILDTETTWRRRIIKENIAIKKLNPDLNVMEEGKAPLSALYNNLPSKFVRPRTEDYHSGKDKDKVTYSNRRPTTTTTISATSHPTSLRKEEVKTPKDLW